MKGKSVHRVLSDPDRGGGLDDWRPPKLRGGKTQEFDHARLSVENPRQLMSKSEVAEWESGEKRVEAFISSFINRGKGLKGHDSANCIPRGKKDPSGTCRGGICDLGSRNK